MQEGKFVTDMVFISASDLGGEVDLEEFSPWFSSFDFVEGRWAPLSSVEPTPQFGDEIGRRHGLFALLTRADEEFLDQKYLNQRRYRRFKLADIEIEPLGGLKSLGKLKAEPYLLVHKAGIAVLSVWISFGELDADQIIKIENKFPEERCLINSEEWTLSGYIEHITSVLQAAVVFRGKESYADGYRRFCDLRKRLERKAYSEMKERLRNPWWICHPLVCVRVDCGTIEEAIEKHLLELRGILTKHGGWRYVSEEKAREELGQNLSGINYVGFFITPYSYLMVGSKRLEELLGNIGYEEHKCFLAMIGEFLTLMGQMIGTYMEMVRKKLSYISLKRLRGEDISEKDVKETDRLIKEVEEGLMEYRNIEFVNSDPARGTIEYGKELAITKLIEFLERDLKMLKEEVYSWYQERMLVEQVALAKEQKSLGERQELLTKIFGILNAVSIGGFVWEVLRGLNFPPIEALAGATGSMVAAFLVLYWYIKRLAPRGVNC